MPLKKKQLNMFLQDGMSIKELCSTVDGLQLWIDNQGPCRRARNTYLQALTPPDVTTYYITGYERHRAAVLLAKHLFPDFQYNTNLCFPVAGPGDRFKDYDGEPVLIWYEYDSQQIHKKDGVLGFTEWLTAEVKKSPCLVHKFNLIVSAEPFEEFIHNLQVKAKRQGIDAEELRDTLCNHIPVVITTEKERCTVQHNPDATIIEYSLPDGWWVR